MAEQKRLRTSVHVHQDDGTVHVYGPDDTDIPAEDLSKIGDHCFLEDGEQPVVDRPPGPTVDATDTTSADDAPQKTASRSRKS